MKKILSILLLLYVTNIYGQNPIKFKLNDNPIYLDNNGQPINRGSEFNVIVYGDGNGNTTTRQLLFDFEFDNTNFEIVSINHTGTGGNGGILPYGSNVQLTWNSYPGYTYVQPTNTSGTNATNGTYMFNNCNYIYQSGGPNTIIRATLTWASTNGMPYTGYSDLLVVRMRLKQTSTATMFNPIKLDFVAGWDNNGIQDITYMDEPKKVDIIMNQNAGKYVNVFVDVNQNLTNLTNLKVVFVDSLTNIGHLFPVLSDGTVDVNQTQLQQNNVYYVQVLYDMDKSYDVYNNAITISDFSTTQNEFNTMGLDGSNGAVLQTGQSLYAADINRNKKIDGGDLPKLLAQVAGVDVLYTLPPGYTVGSGGYMSIPTWDLLSWNNITTSNWSTITYPKTYFKTGVMGDVKTLNLKYLLWGDANRSHSSQVIDQNGLVKNFSIKSTSFINSPYNINSIDVTLPNLTVVSNTIELPVTVNTNVSNVGGLQFQFEYDTTKIKFEELLTDLPNTWYVFANSKSGKVKFGALDQNNNKPLTGIVIPFKLKFTTIGEGVDILTSIKVSPIMDASDNKGIQLGINLNNKQIKLTGYNNF
jgi:hypothetical protein